MVSEFLIYLGLTVAIAWLLMVLYAIVKTLQAMLRHRSALLRLRRAYARHQQQRWDQDRRQHVRACQRGGYDPELQAAYEIARQRADVELAWLLPPTMACPPEERR